MIDWIPGRGIEVLACGMEYSDIMGQWCRGGRCSGKTTAPVITPFASRVVKVGFVLYRKNHLCGVLPSRFAVINP